MRTGCVQAASDENEGVIRLLLMRTRGCVQAAFDENRGMVRLLLMRTGVCSGCFW